jgi:hypothetical protein
VLFTVLLPHRAPQKHAPVSGAILKEFKGVCLYKKPPLPGGSINSFELALQEFLVYPKIKV